MGEALGLHREALALRLRSLEPAHPLIAESHNNIGLALSSLGRLDDALGAHKQALHIRRECGRPDAANSLNNIAAVLFKQGQLEQAVGMHREAYAMMVESDPGPLNAPTVLYNIGVILRKQGKIEEALAVFREVEGVWVSAFGDAHTAVVRVRQSILNAEIALKSVSKSG